MSDEHSRKLAEERSRKIQDALANLQSFGSLDSHDEVWSVLYKQNNNL
jgi:hypothetical protein